MVRQHLACLLVLAGCAPEEGVIDCTKDSPCVRLDAGGDLGGLDLGGRLDVPRDDILRVSGLRALVLRPARADLVVRGSTPETARFTAVGVRASDGAEVPVDEVLWTLPPTPIGTLANDGTFTASGAAAGSVLLQATVALDGARTLSATAAVTVRVDRTFFGSGTPEAVAARFGGAAVADPARSAGMLYPLDRAVLPDNVAPPDVQWERGNAGDVYRVRAVKPSVAVTAYVTHTGPGFRYDWPIDPAAWASLLASDLASPVVVTVDRLDAARSEVVAGDPATLTVARGSLSGSIYYWDLSDGRIQRIDAYSALRSVAVPSPPQHSGSGPGERGSRCIACHTVSRDGRYLSVEMYGGNGPGASFDLTSADLSRDPAPTVYGPRPDLVYLFSTFSPDAQYVLINRANELALLRRMDGSALSGTGLPTAGAAHPEWSPDGGSVAFVTNTDGTWAVDFTRGDLALLPRTGETTFGPPRVLHQAASTPGGPVDAHPSFTPDGRFLVFQHGEHSRSATGDTDHPGRLELISAAGGAPMPLARANGNDGRSAWWPNASPFNVGGYYWIAFHSRRDYGNAQAGTRGARRRQLWVTAVSNSPVAGSDPSNVPYWLPGQDVSVQNMSAYWAPVPCRPTGIGCRSSTECCSGHCETAPDRPAMCTAPRPSECRRRGFTCSGAGDCCEGLVCLQSVCLMPPG